MKRILVIGGTGNAGRQVISQLTQTNASVRAFVRNPQSANLPSQVEVVPGDLTIPATLEAALREIETVFLVWTAPGAAAIPALERITQHARRVVFLSAPHRTPHPFFQQPNRLASLYLNMERFLEASSLQWTFLRPGMFASNALLWWAPQTRRGDVVRWPYAEAPTAPIDPRDIAAAAVRLLSEPGHDKKDYVVTGPASLTHREQVQILGDVLGRRLRYEEITPEEARRELLPIGPPPAIDMLLNAWQAALGQPAYITSTFKGITGTPARTFGDWAVDHAAQFQP